MVHPDHQRRGLDSRLLRCLYEESNRSGQFAFVMAALPGVRLYTEFESRTVWVVSAKERQITAMPAVAPSLKCCLDDPPAHSLPVSFLQRRFVALQESRLLPHTLMPRPAI